MFAPRPSHTQTTHSQATTILGNALMAEDVIACPPFQENILATRTRNSGHLEGKKEGNHHHDIM